MHCHLFSIKHPQIKIEKNQSPTEEHEKSFSPLWNWNSRVKNPRKIQGSKLDTITCRRKAGTQRSPFHPIDNPDGTRRVQASLAGRSHFNRGAEVLTWKVQVCAVQVCVRGWPTCRGRAAHYSNPCVAVCARCPPPPRLYHFAAASTMYTFAARTRSTFAGSRPDIHVKMCWSTCVELRNEDTRFATFLFFLPIRARSQFDSLIFLDAFHTSVD